MPSESESQTGHQVIKNAYTHGTKLYRVIIHERKGPSLVILSNLSSGQVFTFDRLYEPTDEENDTKSTILRLTQSEVRDLRGIHFTVEEVDAADIKSIDPFGDPMEDSMDSASILTSEDWPLVQTPTEYLDNNSDGPKAELARKMIEAGFPNASSRK